MPERTMEGVTAFPVERATGQARSLLRDRHGNGAGLRVLRDGGEENFQRFLHRGGIARRSGPGRARRRGGGGSGAVGSEVDRYRIAVAPNGVWASFIVAAEVLRRRSLRRHAV